MNKFRHDPSARIRRSVEANLRQFDWSTEPVATAHRQFTYQNKIKDKEFAVPLSATPVVIEGVGIIVVSDDGFIRFMNFKLDKIFWERRLSASIYSSPIFAPEIDAVIVASMNGKIVAWSLSGTPKWQVKIEDPIYASLVISQRRLFVACFNRAFHAFDLHTGKGCFSLKLNPSWGVAAGGIASFRDPYATPCVQRDGSIVVACGESLACYSPNGESNWHAYLHAGVRSSPASSHSTDRVIVGLVNGDVVVLDGRNGDEVARIPTNAKIVHSPAISNDIACIANERGDVLGIDLVRLSIVWVYQAGTEMDYTSMTLSPAGDFVFVTKRGNAICVGATDGKFIWETSQHLQLANHEREMHTTPIITRSGMMFCGSYGGSLYRFSFREKEA